MVGKKWASIGLTVVAPPEVVIARQSKRIVRVCLCGDRTDPAASTSGTRRCSFERAQTKLQNGRGTKSTTEGTTQALALAKARRLKRNSMRGWRLGKKHGRMSANRSNSSSATQLAYAREADNNEHIPCKRRPRLVKKRDRPVAGAREGTQIWRIQLVRFSWSSKRTNRYS